MFFVLAAFSFLPARKNLRIESPAFGRRRQDSDKHACEMRSLKF